MLVPLSATVAQNDAAKPDRYVDVRIILPQDDMIAGETLQIGFEKTIYPGWHTYWVNPGDSGSAPATDWAMPEGFNVAPIQWPIPEKLPYGPLLNYGYSGTATLYQALTAPEDLPEGPITFTVDLELLVCSDICIPEFSTLSFILNNDGNTGEATLVDSKRYESDQAAFPVTVNWAAEYTEAGSDLVLTIEPEWTGTMDDIEFFPYEWGIVQNAAEPDVRLRSGVLIIEQERDTRPLSDIHSLQGILAYSDSEGNRKGVEITANPAGMPAPTEIISETRTSLPFLQILIYAFLGGLILNLMPCVFPVLSMKALSLAKMAEKDRNLVRMNGLAYTVGVLLSFALIAGILMALRAGGAEIGWGFQLQNPLIIGLLAYLLFMVGLSLSGLFEITGRFTQAGENLTRKDGLTGPFFTGVLATLVATPCTAPFMGAAMGAALALPVALGMTIFIALGFGLAFPYLLLCFVPALRQWMPKPGAWMERFKEFLAFPMYLSAAWLAWVLTKQAGPDALLGLMIGGTLIALALWVFKNSRGRLWLKILSFIILLSSILFLPNSDARAPTNMAAPAGDIQYDPYSQARLEEALMGNDPVFVEMTADWCITCKFNHRVAINIDSTKALFAEKNVRYLLGDWTNQDANITAYLQSFDRNGVPIYVYYGPRDSKTGARPDPVLLPQILTPSIVANAIK